MSSGPGIFCPRCRQLAARRSGTGYEIQHRGGRWHVGSIHAITCKSCGHTFEPGQGGDSRRSRGGKETKK